MSAPARLPDFAIGSDVRPGLAKLTEEAGELAEITGKLMAFPHGPHPSGRDLTAEFIAEAGDVLGTLQYIAATNNDIDADALEQRAADRLRTLMTWDENDRSKHGCDR